MKTPLKKNAATDLLVGNILNADQVAVLKQLSGYSKKQGPRAGGRYRPSGYAPEKQGQKSSAGF